MYSILFAWCLKETFIADFGVYLSVAFFFSWIFVFIIIAVFKTQTTFCPSQVQWSCRNYHAGIIFLLGVYAFMNQQILWGQNAKESLAWVNELVLSTRSLPLKSRLPLRALGCFQIVVLYISNLYRCVMGNQSDNSVGVLYTEKCLWSTSQKGTNWIHS